MIQMRIRRIILFSIMWSSSLLLMLFSTSSLIVKVDAKLHLWVKNKKNHNTTEEDNLSLLQGRGGKSIRDRLKLFHNHDDDDENTRATTHYSASQYYDQIISSPTEYLSFMLQYISSNIQAMSDYLYSSDVSSNSRSRLKDILSEPKDAFEGLLAFAAAIKSGYLGGVKSVVDGVYELGYGTISACISLIGAKSNDNKHPLPYAFFTELAYGLRSGANHAFDGLYLFAAGAVVGTRNLVVGISRTPRAIQASKLGMLYYPRGKKQIASNEQGSYQEQNNDVAVWDYYLLDYEDREIRQEEERWIENNEYPTRSEKKKGTTRNVRRRRSSVTVKDRRFYDVLGVPVNANSKEIRSAYRREALKHHPDKQTTSSTPTANNMPQADLQIDGFLDLTEAYRILSNEASRDAYDQHGLCFREESLLPEDGSHEQYIDLVDELFGASAVIKYVGVILIAPIVNEMFGFTDLETSPLSVEVQDLQQRRRVVDISLYLRDRVNSYVCGDETIEEFTISCRKEVELILKDGGEPAFLRVIGKTLLEEAGTGHVLPFVRKTVSNQRQKIKSSIANARVFAPVYFKAALSGLILGSFKKDDLDDDDDSDCYGRHKSNKESVDQDAVLDLLWQYVVNDTVSTLRLACEKLFSDRGVRDGSLAFVKTASLIKYQRAEAIRILAKEMLAVSADYQRQER